jgi:hypothetical protein
MLTVEQGQTLPLPDAAPIDFGESMTTEDLILGHLHTKRGPPVGDEILADLNRLLDAGDQLTEREELDFIRDTMLRLANDESRPIEVRADWNAVARLYIAQEGL